MFEPLHKAAPCKPLHAVFTVQTESPLPREAVERLSHFWSRHRISDCSVQFLPLATCFLAASLYSADVHGASAALFMSYSFFVINLGSRLCIYSAGDRCLGHLDPFATTRSSVLSVFVCVSRSVGTQPAPGCTPLSAAAYSGIC